MHIFLQHFKLLSVYILSWNYEITWFYFIICENNRVVQLEVQLQSHCVEMCLFGVVMILHGRYFITHLHSHVIVVTGIGISWLERDLWNISVCTSSWILRVTEIQIYRRVKHIPFIPFTVSTLFSLSELDFHCCWLVPPTLVSEGNVAVSDKEKNEVS